MDYVFSGETGEGGGNSYECELFNDQFSMIFLCFSIKHERVLVDDRNDIEVD